MEVLDSFESLLTNAEVAEVLKDNKKRGHEDSRPLVMVELEKRVTKYLAEGPGKGATREQVEELSQRLSEVKPLEGETGLKVTETLNIANLRPTQLVEMYTVLASAEARFGDEKLGEMLEIVEQCLPLPA
mmetsp:Transcript_12384/g.24544  ORF Transcript_12384/g.24544 Transcript_12384/m.24544 type:complete len:130 (-) Transcript_12384:149-538(-)|eukprot:CAMPEP_0173383950 /NCGR_PEP_ID=MMETSP1356-20130122/6529_1 /TAXON_ID=77927 ORGANISM="Hemiselmis virescens, Strain PCC157" /NCGR_SAMPLE_ID=MMETSP1356 /ASSEMBLY_ACC=CAM_ASM_000847 /LENGTH=129 /DNA_ID=CAMNT_0014339067 /DNA_START=20 /DNA_END=409 /DNA_ORIENTATION=-